ncbi:hypothetical protein J2X45_001498 [Caulobacter sp. BE264]|uniref:hypothetical protein n=1 Tax=Caulobacter sp. BE264 TaxID=2817724 RepID=UPI0028572CD5|nr:hypothetical protein [Caulobacter sp. BE264]MDR7230417.1 hypothetical protein [Caulobacter sp. BE264]
MFENKTAWIRAGGIVLWCLVLAAALSTNRMLSLSIDASYHLQVMEVVRRAFLVPPVGHEWMAEMVAYPKLSHRFAGLFATLGWSEINALLMAGVLSAGVAWLVLFDQARRVSLTYLTICAGLALINVYALRGVIGAELVRNFFYPQMVGEAVAALGVAGGAVVLARSRPLFAVYGAAMVLLCGCFHLVPTLRLCGALMAMLGLGVLRDMIHARRIDGMGLAGLALIAAGLLGNPFFWSMRWMAANNGSIHFAMPMTLNGLAGLSALLVALSAWIFLIEALRPPAAVEEDAGPTRAAVLLAALGAGAGVSMLAQYALYALRGEGSEYAVLKHGFGVCTLLVFVIPLWGMTVLGVRGAAFEERSGWGARLGVIPALAAQLLVMLAVFLRPSVYDVPQVTAVLRDVREVRLTRGLHGEQVMFSATQVPAVATYMGTIGMLQSPHGGNVLSLLDDGRPNRPGDVPYIVTLAGDAYDKPGCRSGAPLGLVVVVVGACVEPPSLMFKAGGSGVSALRTGWSAPEAGGVWADGRQSIVEMRLSEAQRSLPGAVLEVATFAFLPLQTSTRTVTVSAGGASETFTFNRQNAIRHDYRLLLPAEALKSGVVQVVFDTKDPQTPASLGLGVDNRLMGAGLEAMRIVSAAP